MKTIETLLSSANTILSSHGKDTIETEDMGTLAPIFKEYASTLVSEINAKSDGIERDAQIEEVKDIIASFDDCKRWIRIAELKAMPYSSAIREFLKDETVPTYTVKEDKKTNKYSLTDRIESKGKVRPVTAKIKFSDLIQNLVSEKEYKGYIRAIAFFTYNVQRVMGANSEGVINAIQAHPSWMSYAKSHGLVMSEKDVKEKAGTYGVLRAQFDNEIMRTMFPKMRLGHARKADIDYFKSASFKAVRGSNVNGTYNWVRETESLNVVWSVVRCIATKGAYDVTGMGTLETACDGVSNNKDMAEAPAKSEAMPEVTETTATKGKSKRSKKVAA